MCRFLCIWLPLADVSQELQAIKARVFEMEEEAEKLREVQYDPEQQLICNPQAGES